VPFMDIPEDVIFMASPPVVPCIIRVSFPLRPFIR
jgi:hypothetical protein